LWLGWGSKVRGPGDGSPPVRFRGEAPVGVWGRKSPEAEALSEK